MKVLISKKNESPPGFSSVLFCDCFWTKKRAAFRRSTAALAALMLAASMVFAACFHPDDPGPEVIPEANKEYKTSIIFSVSAPSLNVFTYTIPDITIPVNKDGKRDIGEQEIEFEWESGYQKNAENLSVVVDFGPEVPNNVVSEITGALTINLAPGSAQMSTRDKSVIEAKIGTALSGSQITLDNASFGDAAGEYDIASPITVKINNDNAKTFTITVPSLTDAGSNLSASMDWLKEYRNGNIALSADEISSYDQGTLSSDGRQLDMTLATPSNADPYDKEIRTTDKSDLESKLKAVLKNTSRSIDFTNSNSWDGSGTNPKDIGTNDYTVVSTPTNITLGGLDATWQQVGNKIDLTIKRSDAEPTQRTESSIATFMAAKFNTLPAEIVGKDVDITFTKEGTKNDIPISYIYYVKKAVSDKAGAGKTVAIKPLGTLVPSYSSKDWIIVNSARNAVVYNLFTDITGDGPIIDGLSIESIGGKKVLTYDMPIQVDNISYDSTLMPGIYGFGIKCDTNGAISPISGTTYENVVISGPMHMYSDGTLSPTFVTGRVDSWADYMEQLAKAGLSCIQMPDLTARNDTTNIPFPKHNVSVYYTGSASDNIMENGIYDFLCRYKYPDSSGGTTSFEDRLGSMLIGNVGFTLNGNAAPAAGTVPARTFPGINDGNALSSSVRKNTDGTLNPAYQGNIPAGLVPYLKEKLNLTTLSNVNIYGDYGDWKNNGAYVGNNYFNAGGIPGFKNVGLAGNYNISAITLGTNIEGVLVHCNIYNFTKLKGKVF
ncbi:MAG: hypothetical protein LBN21_04365 [Treponema sp.]|jgi:hypothetical protein|nr:hypothetical protein [Treponema sp.]